MPARSLLRGTAILTTGFRPVRTWRFLVGCLVLCVGARITNAQLPSNTQLLDYGPYSGYALGRGIVGDDYANPKPSCIKGDTRTTLASASHVYISIVYTADEYKQAFHIDQAAQASFLGIGGGDELHFGQETTRSGSLYDIIVEVSGEMDSNLIDNIQWDPEHQALMNSGRPADIQRVRQECGDRFIETVFNQARLFAVLHVSSQIVSALTQFGGKASGKVDLDVVSASGSLGGDLNISSANKSGAVTVDIYSEGIGGVVPTAAMVGITSADGIQAIVNALASYLMNLKPTGQPVKYELAQLPGMPVGDLSNTQIFNYLSTLKSSSVANTYRLNNVTMLLTPVDPRRSILKQPQADVVLKHLQGALTTYLQTVSAAHEACAQAFTLKECAAKANGVGAPPAFLSVELMPVTPPIVGLATFFIDGIAVSPGEAGLLYSSGGTTLLDAARSFNPHASNVDVAIPVLGGYVAFIDLVILSPHGGSHRLRGPDFAQPKYFKPEPIGSGILDVVHADSQQPCNLSVGENGVIVIDQACLTPVGKVFRDVALADVAQMINNQSLSSVPLGGTATGCFGGPPSSFQQYAGTYFGLVPSATANPVTAQVGVYLWTGVNPYFYLFAQDETHDRATWAQLEQSRLSTAAAQNNAPGPNPCAQQVP